MLRSLRISKYVLIDELEIDFHSGFSVITGETGAGKSIILGAVGLILGERADVKSIKAGAEKCTVEAVFSAEQRGISVFLKECDFDDNGDECIMRREILKSGKSRAFINDTPATAAQLKTLGRMLIDIHSQHKNLLISGSDFQMGVVDSMAHDSCELAEYASAFVNYKKADTELSKLRMEIAKKQENEDYIRYSLQQFEDADLKDNEQEDLEKEQQALSHIEEITAALAETCNALDNDEGGAISAISHEANSLSRISAFLPEAEEVSQRLDSVCIELRDINDELQGKLDDADFDPAKLQHIDDRLSLIYEMERKFRVSSYDELLDKKNSLEAQLAMIDDSSQLLHDKEKEREQMHAEMEKKGKALSAKRKGVTPALSREIEIRLKRLGMPDAKFEIELSQADSPSAMGCDNVCFIFSANKGSAPRNISDVASGGEIARIMLCLKAVVSSAQHLPTIVFDEIDTGVSGRIAEQMALSMQDICANGTQVICITHLPQIAAKGEHHYLVYKQNDDEAASSRIKLLNPAQRREEIAKMLSGSEITDAAMTNAEELLKTK